MGRVHSRDVVRRNQCLVIAVYFISYHWIRPVLIIIRNGATVTGVMEVNDVAFIGLIDQKRLECPANRFVRCFFAGLQDFNFAFNEAKLLH